MRKRIFSRTTVVFFVFFSFFLLLVNKAVIRAYQDSWALCIQSESMVDCKVCIKELEGKDSVFLSGNHGSSSSWTGDQNIVLVLCGKIREGNGNALAIGFRLGLILNGRLGDDVIEALIESMVKEPKEFMVYLQGMIDFSRRENQTGALKQYFWNTFVRTGAEYEGRAKEEIKILRKRREIILRVKDPKVNEDREYIEEMLSDKIQNLSSEM